MKEIHLSEYYLILTSLVTRAEANDESDYGIRFDVCIFIARDLNEISIGQWEIEHSYDID